MSKSIHKLSFQLNEDDFETVAFLAKEHGVSIGALVRKALALHFFLTDVQDKGGEVVIEKNDGSMLCMRA